MAESAHDASAPLFPPHAHAPPPLQSRRVSFRQSLTDASLPLEYLDQLEQKRKQLDESIHKYIASKEREYKNFERELEQRVRHARAGELTAGTEHVGTLDGKRVTGSESTMTSSFEPDGGGGRSEGRPVNEHRRAAVHALPASSLRRDLDSMLVESEDGSGTLAARKAALAGLKDRRASAERDRDLVGLFMPPFLPALESDQKHAERRVQPERTASAPAVISSADTPDVPTANDGDAGPTRALSDPSLRSSLQAKAKRPVQLAIASRTSSSGSSADGRLASAMKSPTHKERPVRKRVSLAVGDCIVAPSDSVPMSLSSNNNAPSHSRSRSSIVSEGDGEIFVQIQQDEDDRPAHVTDARAESRSMSSTSNAKTPGDAVAPSKPGVCVPPAPISTTKAIRPPTTATGINPDGDFFDLEEDADGNLVRYDVSDPDDDVRSQNSDDDHPQNETPGPTNPTSHALGPHEHYDYDPEAGLIPTADSTIPLNFRVGSNGASQQPTNPGFRRPSISHDPTFAGADYPAAARKAAEDEIYGSSYSRHSTKGSFTSGSLGESFMERNAAEMRMRAAIALARREAEVKS